MAETASKTQLESLLNERESMEWHGGWMNKPFRVDGFVCATNGHFVVGIEDADTEVPLCPAGLSAETIKAYLTMPLSGEAFDVEHLKEWSRRENPACNICHGTLKQKCDECDGAGKTECVCDCGETSHFIACETCAETGKVDCLCHYAVPVNFFGKVINALLIHRAVKLFYGDYQIGGDPDKGKPIVFGGKGWRAAVMPMREIAKETYEPKSCAGAAAGGESRA